MPPPTWAKFWPTRLARGILSRMSTAMILAAGLGTRLRPLTDELPKPLVPVGDAPAMAHIQRWLAGFGFRRALVNTHHLGAAFAGVSWPLETHLLHEPSILGTAGGVAGARPLLPAADPLLVWNGDILASVDVAALFAALNSGAVAAWSVAPRPRGEGTVGLDARGHVVRLRQVRCGVEERGGDFLGIQALSPDLLPQLPPEGCMVGDVLAPLLERGATIATVDHHGPWDDIGSIASYLRANLRWLADRPAYLGPGASCLINVDQSVIGAGAQVSGEGALVRSVVWPGARAVGPLADVVVTSSGQVARG